SLQDGEEFYSPPLAPEALSERGRVHAITFADAAAGRGVSRSFCIDPNHARKKSLALGKAFLK
ncbi:MAG: hypothetical protein ACTHJG_06635, partial [Rhodanobacteraceae bacterium]